MRPEIKLIEPTSDLNKLVIKTWASRIRWTEVGEYKTIYPERYQEIIDKIENLEIRPDDVFITSHPRCGTTWTQEMVWLIAHDCNFDTAKELINSRIPFMEVECLYSKEQWSDMIKNRPFMDCLNNAPKKESPRFFKTHNPFNLLPKQIRDGEVQPKIIHVIRNPKDTCVSYYHFTRTLDEYFGTFDEFCEQFMAGKINYGPFFGHAFSYWNERHRPNLLIIKYEDMKRNMPEVLRTVAKFLNKELSEEQISVLTDHLSFEKLSKNRHVNYEESFTKYREKIGDAPWEKFMRKGKVGGYRDDMSDEMVKRFDDWTEENTKGTDLNFN